MAKDPTGKDYTSNKLPSGAKSNLKAGVATGSSSNRWDTDKTGGTDKHRESHTKTPTGDRPVPTVPRHDPPHSKVPGPLRAGPYEQPAGPGKTKHPTPNKDAGTGRSKPYGGGSY